MARPEHVWNITTRNLVILFSLQDYYFKVRGFVNKLSNLRLQKKIETVPFKPVFLKLCSAGDNLVFPLVVFL